MKNYILLVVCLLTINLFAQYKYPKTEKAEIVLNSKLAVQLLNEETEFDKSANEAIKEIFTDNWKLTDVEFLPPEAIEDLKSAKDNNYAYLTFSNMTKSDIRRRYINKEGKMSLTGPVEAGGYSYDRTAFTFSFFEYHLEVVRKNRIVTVTDIGFANGELTKIDYLFLCQQLSHLIDSSAKGIKSKEYYNVADNIEKVKSSKLILPKDFFREKDINKMDSYYKYDYNLVDLENYENIILNKTKNNAYVKIIWSEHHKMYLWIVVNAENGSIIAQTGFGGVKFGKHHDANTIIKAKHLKYITSKMAQKVNSRY